MNRKGKNKSKNIKKTNINKNRKNGTITKTI